MRGLKSDRIVWVGGPQILYEERRLYGAESEINKEFFFYNMVSFLQFFIVGFEP